MILDVATFFFCTFSSYQRLRNAWHNIRHVEPDSINPLQIQEKYGFDWKYQEYILGPCEDDEQDSTPAPELAPTDEVQDLSEKIIEQNREAGIIRPLFIILQYLKSIYRIDKVQSVFNNITLYDSFRFNNSGSIKITAAQIIMVAPAIKK